MNENTKIEYWLELAEYDIEVALSLFQSKKYLYVGFFCHLIIEKTLKAYFWYKMKSDPPFSHNLLLLADKSGLINELSEDNVNLLNKLMPLNIEGRYPTDKQLLSQQLTESIINDILNNTLDLQKWIKNLIKY
jgi:HEPN domain-containing protein